MFASEPNAELPDWIDSLNPAQRRAVVHGDGPLLIVAGAGSGKTRTLASRVAWLIHTGVPAERILLLTFTRRAADEMVRRAGALMSSRATGNVWGGTFHSIANRLLRVHGAAVGLGEGFTVLDQADGEALFGVIRSELGVADGKVRFPKQETIAAIYSRTVNEQEKMTKVVEERFPWCSDHVAALRDVFALYRERKREHNVVDYDDLLLYWRALLGSPAAATVRRLFDHVLVDEFQDTNRIQADILGGLVGEVGNLTVVGDDAQAIYSFRAATIANIRGFPDEYPAATLVALEENYRSTPEILDVANAVIAESSELYPKTLRPTRPSGPVPDLVTCFDEAAQSDFVCDTLLEHRESGIPLRDQAVLFRTGHHSDGLELELARRGIPFVKFGGLKFLEAAHIKDLLALLRILDNPEDQLAWHRALQSIPGVGPATAVRIMDTAATTGAEDGVDRLTAFCALQMPVPADSAEPLGELQAALRDVRGEGSSEPPPAQQIDRLLPFCKMVFERNYDDAGVRLADIEHLGTLSASVESRQRFLTDLVLDPPVSTADLAGAPHLDDDYLILSTIHSAKGGEWRAVFVIHAADGNLPSDMALGEPGGLEEERRLMYVALTRAKDHLHVSFPQRFYHRRFGGDDAHSYAPLSRFLTPVTDRFQEIAATPAGHEEGRSSGVVGADPVGAMLDDLFS